MFFTLLTRLPRRTKSIVIMLVDVLVLPLALWSASLLRLAGAERAPLPWWGYALALAIFLPVFTKFGLYHAVVRYLEARAFMAVFGAAATATALFGLVVAAVGVPGVGVETVLLFGLASGGYALFARFVARLALTSPQWRRRRHAERVVIYGAGIAGRQLLRAMRQGTPYRPIAFVDDDADLWRRTVHGLRVHPPSDLPRLVEEEDVSAVLVAIPSAGAAQRARILARIEPLGVHVRLLPGVNEIVSGQWTPSALRDASVEELLGREPVKLDSGALSASLSGRRVLVTGAGGSIGSELCRQVARFRPKLLVLVEQSEYALYTVAEELKRLFPAVPIRCVIADVKNETRIDQVLRDARPDIIFHAAAYKHVPLMEEVNAWEAVRNNTFGTWVVGQAARRHGVRRFVLVSTDKAVNPTNVMGASKRLAELVCLALHEGGPTAFDIVRFGNVLGSTGSVIPKFREQIAAGGPVTVTHPEIIRYFMSIPEAAQLVMQAGSMGRGGEVFVLDMGEPVKIVDLARNMIRLSGADETEVRIEFTGLRPGEKLYEELLADSEETRSTHHPKIRIAAVSRVDPKWADDLVAWVKATPELSDDAVRERIAALLPEYRPWAERPRQEAATRAAEAAA